MTHGELSIATSSICNQISKEGQTKQYGNEFPSSNNAGLDVKEYENEVKANKDEEKRNRIFYIEKDPRVEKRVNEIKSEGKYHKNDKISNNNISEGLEQGAPGKLSPSAPRYYQESEVPCDETGKKTIKNHDPLVDKFVRQVRVTSVLIFIAGIITSSFLSILNFTMGFMVFASTTGFFGGLLLSEALFYRSMEAKA